MDFWRILQRNFRTLLPAMRPAIIRLGPGFNESSTPRVAGPTMLETLLPSLASPASPFSRGLSSGPSRYLSLVPSEKDTFWELRFSIEYQHLDGEHLIKDMTIHGLWKNKLVNGEKIPDNNPNYMIIPDNNPNYMINKPQAQKLLDELKRDHPEVVLEMKKRWKSTNHTTDQEEFWLREILKHGSLDLSYWIQAMQLAAPFFDEDGTCVLLTYMKEDGFLRGTHSCKDLQKKMSARIGKDVLTTFEKKSKGDKLYVAEFSLFLDGSYKLLDYPQTCKDSAKEQEFIVDGY